MHEDRDRRGRADDRGEDVTADAGAAHSGDHQCTRPAQLSDRGKAGLGRGGHGHPDLRGRRCDGAQHLRGVTRKERSRVVEDRLVESGHACVGLRASSTSSTGMSSRTG